MAERRMMAKSIVLSDAFLDMPMSARNLYFTFLACGDDDGFVNNPKSIMRQTGASMDDFRILLAKQYIIAFESGVIVIRHWRIHNYIQKDRYKPSECISEKAMISVDKKGVYTECIQDVSSSDTQVRLGKDSIGEVNNTILTDCIEHSDECSDQKSLPKKTKTKRFVPPTVAEVTAYCQERGNRVNPEAFVDFYASKGWMVGKNPMRDWKAAVRTWERSEGRGHNSAGNRGNYTQPDDDLVKYF